MQSQLDIWKGDFGQAYTDRNHLDWRVRVLAFRQMLGEIKPRRVLEVGCNRGHNLVALREVLGREAELVGVEPNPYALELAQGTGAATVVPGDIYCLPFEDGAFDLVFTAGVLIHVPLATLAAALGELHRCSRKFLLAIEYAAAEETPLSYRGHDHLLWKRNFLKHYRDQFPCLRVVGQGHWGEEHGFDHTNWWLLDKTGERDASA
ncbi:MAG TPA: pseudaminic acid biosynthesis-associated methylase [Gemmataceae bacterium]|jgi:pseudaminic acid biosynthesis-associated methylase